jgi:hypothetical protein
MLEEEYVMPQSEHIVKSLTTLFAASAIAFCALTSHTAHAQQAIADGRYTISNECNGKVLGLENDSPNPGGNAVLRDAGSAGAINWQVNVTGDGSYILRASGTQSALQTSYERTANETDVDVWSYWGSNSQRWLISDGGNGTYKLSFAAASAMALDAKYRGANGETEVWLYNDNGSCAQRWQFSKVKDDGKKLLETGWDMPRPPFLKSNIADMQSRPFDGVVLAGSGKSEVFTKTPTLETNFAQDRADLEGLDWGRFTDNFLVMQSGTPAGWDWFSNDDWAASEANARQFAKLAKSAKLKGVLFDAEPYLGNPWNYELQPDVPNRTFPQYQAKVRERGKRFMQVMQEEYPGLKVLMYYGLTAVAGNIEDKPSDDVLQQRLKEDGYGLWASFYNGMLDAADTAAELIEGNEPAYYYLFAKEYDEAAAHIRNDLIVLIEKPLQTKYGAAAKVAQAIYADGVMNLWNTPRFCGYYFENDADRLKQLEHNVYHSLRSADRYAWFYNENMDWWGSKGNGVKIPNGMQQAIESARAKYAAGDPLGLDLETISSAAKQKCDTRRNLGGRISYPDSNAGLAFEVTINGNVEKNVFCGEYNNAQSYSCVFPAGVTATVKPVKDGYAFEPPIRSYSTTDNNIWQEDYKAIKQ